MDVRLEDGTIIKNVPPGTTKAMLAERLNKANTQPQTTRYQSPDDARLMETIKSGRADNAVTTFLKGVTQGATANFADEIVAGGETLTGSDYDATLARERQQQRTNAREHPIADIAGNVTGAILGPGKLMKAPKGVIGMIKQGVATGAIYGFGQGEGGLQERATSAAVGGSIGGAMGGIMGVGVNAFNKVRPKNVAAKFVNKQFDANPQFSAESARIGKDIGQTYTPGQATGSRSLLTIEGLIRRHPASADKMQAFDEKQLSVSLNNLVNNLDNLHKNPSGPEATGGLVAKSFDKVFTGVTKVRRDTAKVDFGKVDELAGRYRVIKPNNLSQTIDDLAKEFDVPGGGDASSNLVRKIQGIKTELDRAGPHGLSAKETQRLLEVYGNASRGTGKIFQDLDTGQQRMIAGKLQGALMKDIDEAADAGGHVGEIATALKTARDNYRANSKAINELEQSVLGRLFGGDYDKAPERIAQAMRNMKPSELRQSMDILNKADPATSQSVKRFLVEDAMASAGVNPLSGAPQPQVAGEAMFSPAKFLTAIRKSPVWGDGVFTPAERKAMETAVRDLERVAFRAGTDGSPTAPLQMALSVLARPVGQTAAGGVLGGGAALVTGGDVKEGAFAGATAGGLGGMAIPRLAKAITTPQGQQALRTLSTAKPSSAAARAATAALIGLFAPEAAPDETGGAK